MRNGNGEEKIIIIKFNIVMMNFRKKKSHCNFIIELCKVLNVS